MLDFEDTHPKRRTPFKEYVHSINLRSEQLEFSIMHFLFECLNTAQPPISFDIFVFVGGGLFLF